MKIYNEAKYLWKRALVLSSVIALMVTVLTLKFVQPKLALTDRSATVGDQGAAFAATPREDLEAMYHQAWLAVKQNYVNCNKLSNWDAWEHRYDGRIRTDRQLAEALGEMLSALNDTHSFYISEKELRRFEQANSGKLVGIGIELDPAGTIVGIMPGAPADKAGLVRGDVVTAVDGHYVSSVDELIDLIRGSGQENTEVEIAVQRRGKSMRVTATRAIIRRLPAVLTTTYGSPETGNSVRIANLRSETVIDELAGAINQFNASKTKGLVLDLRGVQGGSPESAALVVSLFLKDGFVCRSTSLSGGQVETRDYRLKGGKLSITSTLPTSTTTSTLDMPTTHYDGDLVVLVDNATSGASELIACALKANKRATVVGMKTAGKGSAQKIICLSKKHAIRLTSSFYLGADLQPIDGLGISPDVPVIFNVYNQSRIFRVGMIELRKQIDRSTKK